MYNFMNILVLTFRVCCGYFSLSLTLHFTVPFFFRRKEELISIFLYILFKHGKQQRICRFQFFFKCIFTHVYVY